MNIVLVFLVARRHQLSTGQPILTNHSKKYSLLNLMPPPVEKVLEDHVWSKTYDELRAFIIDNMGRWEKICGGSSINALEPDSPILLEGEDGELFPLEIRG